MSSDLGERWLTWLRTLCLGLLQEDRVLVQRKALQYFLTHLSVEHLSRLTLLPEFLKATNRSQLFDPEDENKLWLEDLKKFVAGGSVELLLEALVAIPWETVPLVLWIESLESEQVKSVSKELLFKLCLSVSALENVRLRRHAQRRVVYLFENTLDMLSLRDYMICMESMYKEGDVCFGHDFERFIHKIKNCTSLESYLDCFNWRCYNIFFNYNLGPNDWKIYLFHTFIEKIQTIPEHKRCLWRLVLYREILEKHKDFYRNMYNVDTSLLKKGVSLEKMQGHLLEKLECLDSEEISILKAQCVNLFTQNLNSWSQLEELNLDPLELLDQCTEETRISLVRLLGSHKKRLKDEKVLPALIYYVRRFDVSKYVLNYAYHNLTNMEFEGCLTDLLHQQKFFTIPKVQLSVPLFLKLLIEGKPSTGMARIEAACLYSLSNIGEYNAQIRWTALKYIRNCENVEMQSKIFKELLKMNEMLSIQHPHYTENSEVHRKRIRIAFAMIALSDCYNDSISLDSLLLPNDLLNINLLHEFLVGMSVDNIDWALKALPSLQPRQQESYLSVTYINILKHFERLKEDNRLSEIFTLLLPFTMAPSYETRTLAQLILHKLAVKCEEENINIPLAVTLKNSIEASLGEKLTKPQSLEPRPLLLTLLTYFTWVDQYNISFIILYMTKAPFDEVCFVKNDFSKFIVKELKKLEDVATLTPEKKIMLKMLQTFFQ